MMATSRCSSRTGYRIIDLHATEQQKKVNKIDWDVAQIERGGFAHFMLKEIFEQPTRSRTAMRGRLLREEGTSKLGGLNLTDEELLAFDNIVITACGTSWHSALIGEHMIEELTRVPVEVEYASEFRYRNPIVNERTLCIVISQSGETADTLAAMREAKRRGARTLGIVNVVGSTIAREADGGIYLHAGPEIGVASTKAFTSQVIALLLFTLKLGRLRDLSILRGREIIEAMNAIPAQVQADPRPRAGDREHRRRIQARVELPVPRTRLQLPGGARGRAQAEGDQLHPRRRVPGRGDEARADRADRRDDARRVHRAARLGVRQGDVERGRGEGAKGPRHRHHESRRAVARRKAGLRVPHSGDDRHADAGARRACRSSCSRTTSP